MSQKPFMHDKKDCEDSSMYLSFLCTNYSTSFIFQGFIHLRLQQRLSHCPLGNNLLSHGLYGERFQKITKNFSSSVLRENWHGDLRKRMKLKKLLTRKPLIDFLRCSEKPETKIKGHIGLEIMSRMICYYIGMQLVIVPSVHRQKKNWASKKGGCIHTGGSISLQDHDIRLSKELGRSAYIDEIFQQTHLRKDTSQFVDDRSRQTHEDFEARLSQARSDVASSVDESQTTPLDPVVEERLRTQCWITVAGPKQKGHIYGTGDLSRSYKCGDSSFTQGSSSHTRDLEINQLREELCQSNERIHQSDERIRRSDERLCVFESVLRHFLPPEALHIIDQQQPDQQQQNL